MSSQEVQIVLSAVCDGRSRDLRYRQRQFLSLHRWIVDHSAEIQHAICRDDKVPEFETRLVVATALRDLRTAYDSLELKKELKEEYSVKKKKCNEGRRVPDELVYLTLEKYTILYCLVNALSACIAAGSCCLIELPSDQRFTSAALRRCVAEALDNTTIAVVNARPSPEILNRCLIIDQAGALPSSVGQRTLKSDPGAGVVAIVDRTADLSLAAREIIHAAAFLSGRGPYAPTWILVNEFVEAEFLEALGKLSSGPKEAFSTANGSAHPVRNEFVFNAKAFELTRVSERQVFIYLASLATTATSKERLVIPLLAVSSHDDAIDTLNGITRQPLSASYVFADPSAAKYLTQFVKSRASFVNHIPARLLVGPSAPLDFPVSSISRYRREMIEVPAPQFVKAPQGDTNASSLSDRLLEQALYKASVQPLKPTGQAKEGDKNFFVQAMLTSYVFVVAPVIISSIVSAGYLGMKMYAHLR